MLSEPLTVTVVALVAVTVNVDEPPAVIEVGLAAIVTIGVGVLPEPVPSPLPEPVLEPVPPHPENVITRGIKKNARSEGVLKADGRCGRIFIAYSFSEKKIGLKTTERKQKLVEGRSLWSVGTLPVFEKTEVNLPADKYSGTGSH